MYYALCGWYKIISGALKLRITRPKINSINFYQFRKEWNQSISKSFNFKIEIKDNHPPKAGSLIICNHFGFADINTLAAIIPAESQTHYISKKSISEIPLFGWHMRYYGDILFNRKNPEERKRVITQTLEMIQQGKSVVLFPEGTRSKTNSPQIKIKPGLIEAAIQNNIPIHTIAIKGTQNLIEKPWIIQKNQLIKVNMAPPNQNFKNAQEAWEQVLALWHAL